MGVLASAHDSPAATETLWMCSSAHDAVRWGGLQVGGDLRLKKCRSPKVKVARNWTSTNCCLTERWGSYPVFLLCHLILRALRRFPLQLEAGNILPILCSHPACHTDQHLTSIALNLSVCWENVVFFPLDFFVGIACLNRLSWRWPNNLRRERPGLWQRVEPCIRHRVFSCWSSVASPRALKGRYLSIFRALHWKTFGLLSTWGFNDA